MTDERPTLRWAPVDDWPEPTDWEAEYHRLMRACVLEHHVPRGTWPITRTIELGGEFPARLRVGDE